MANRRATVQAINAQVTRSRRYGNLLTLGAMLLNHPEQAQTPLPDTSILVMTQYLRERLRWADAIGRSEDQLFLLVMPETGVEDAGNLLQQIINECQTGSLQALGDNPVPKITFGVSEWAKGDDAQRLIKRVVESLET
jgi:PleD family two-component response regulator